jgi:hypothetical protein
MISDGDTKTVEEFQRLVQEKSWVLGSVGTDEELIKDWSSKFQSTLLILQPHVAVNADFQTYFVNKLKVFEGTGGSWLCDTVVFKHNKIWQGSQFYNVLIISELSSRTKTAKHSSTLREYSIASDQGTELSKSRMC